ncbi:MAG: PC4/YdbC family ssDNA-binding protein [Clostridium sp.]
MGDIKYNIVTTLVVFPAEGKYHKELNLIEWGNHKAKYDIRGWNDDHTDMTKGITLSEEDLKLLKEKLGGINL